MPISPGYGFTPWAPLSSRLVLRMGYDQRPPPGKRASTVAQYRAKSGLRSPTAPNRARSNAEDTWPGAS